ncbi:Ion channel [Trichinella nativa]|uniref:Ion channel n=1 Tax=Trichinella nativa TaxID=6335 RepID=A0A1Y3ETM6_9BILA|nr:Ion channel [Trichinella nativa]
MLGLARKDTMSSRHRRSKVRRLNIFFKRTVAFFFSHIGLCALVVAYTMLGSVLFRAVEGPLEKEVRQLARDNRRQSVDRLWTITYEYNVLYEEEWIQKVQEELLSFKQTLLSAIWKGYDARDYEENVQWTFSGAFLYSLSVITTIGYGNIACRTYFGKALTIGYAIIGIPLMLLFLTNIGDVLAKMFKFLYRRAYKLRMEITIWNKRRKAARLRKITCSPSFRPANLSRSVSDSCTAKQAVKRVSTFTAKEFHQPQGSPGRKFTRSSSLSEVPVTSGRMQKIRIKRSALEQPSAFMTFSTHPSRSPAIGVGSAEPGDMLEDIRVKALIQRYEFEEYILRETMGEKLNRALVPLWLVLLTMLAYLAVGALLFAVWERWDLLDSFYFCFVSLATIGFGDLFPGASMRDDSAAQEKLVITSLYLLFGMALIAMCFNLAQEEVVNKVVTLVSRFGIIKSDSFEAQ